MFYIVFFQVFLFACVIAIPVQLQDPDDAGNAAEELVDPQDIVLSSHEFTRLKHPNACLTVESFLLI